MHENRRPLSDDAIAQLRARSAEDLRAIAELQETAAAFDTPRDDADIPLDAKEREAFLSVQEQSFSRLYALLCREELLWYETYNPAKQSERRVSDLCKTLRHFLNATDLMTGDFLAVGAHSIPNFLYADVQPERLVFVLLHQLVLMWSENPALNILELFAERAHGELRIDLKLRYSAEAETEPLPALMHTALQSGTLAEEAALLTERFCSLYGARLIRHTADGVHCCGISFPAASLPDTRLTLHSDGAPPLIGAHTAYHAVLSCLIPPEVLLWGDVFD